jgi:hypothetical protein
MTTQERKKEIATMLGWEYVSSIDVKEKKYHETIKAGWYVRIPKLYHPKIHSLLYRGRGLNDLRFDSDWNRLMEAVEFIENIKVDEFGYIVEMLPGISRIYLSRNNYTILSTEPKSSRKEATFTAVSDFAKIYNTEDTGKEEVAKSTIGFSK